jgi:hypothetical protein
MGFFPKKQILSHFNKKKKHLINTFKTSKSNPSTQKNDSGPRNQT